MANSTFKFKIRESERDLIFLRHLINEGEISEAELANFRSIEKSGRSYFVVFETEHGQCPLSPSELREICRFGYGQNAPLIPNKMARGSSKTLEVVSEPTKELTKA